MSNIIRLKYSDIYNFILNETYYLDRKSIFSERIYNIVNDLYEKTTCKICNNKVKFHNFNDGYLTYCSNECKYKDLELKRKIKEGVKKTYLDEPKNISEWKLRYVQGYCGNMKFSLINNKNK